jgi:hypothetical protein
VQCEIYTDIPGGQHHSAECSVEKRLNEYPEYLIFNGSVGAGHTPAIAAFGGRRWGAVGQSSLDRCDLFSRETRPGFDGWGNEHGKFDVVA